MDTFIKHGSIPKVICLPVNTLTGVVINFSAISGIGELDSTGLTVLMKEVAEIIVSNDPDTIYPILENTASYLLARDVTFKQFTVFKQYILKAIDEQLRQIEIIRSNWREHADPYLSYSFSEDNLFLTITFNPVYPSRDYAGVLMKEVEKARANNEFIPYKYLRILGMC